jgi:Cd2+/Zn2+-exporting ATPase/Cu+-exporting ATPase
VIEGHSFVDQSTITGESLPVEKVEGTLVYAGKQSCMSSFIVNQGTMNQSGSLTVYTNVIGSNTAFGKIIKAIEEAEKSKAPIQKTADRLAGYIVRVWSSILMCRFILLYSVLW